MTDPIGVSRHVGVDVCTRGKHDRGRDRGSKTRSDQGLGSQGQWKTISTRPYSVPFRYCNSCSSVRWNVRALTSGCFTE